jgi:hypothetical protein
MSWRAVAVTLLIAVLCTAAWLWLALPVEAPPPAASPAQPAAPEPSIAWEAEPPAAIEEEAEEVFKRAFWRRPGADDRILHAVRHAWHDAAGVSRWQWFLIVDPSAGLLQDLRARNVFSLVPGTIPASREAPAWFSYDREAVASWRSLDGRMQLAFRHTDDRIYACASGLGFTKGAAAPSAAEPPATAGSVGRLPNASPPTPPRAD